jgi:hypothetical protein
MNVPHGWTPVLGRPGFPQHPRRSKMAEEIKLDGHHEATLEKIFCPPTSHNIQWHDDCPR